MQAGRVSTRKTKKEYNMPLSVKLKIPGLVKMPQLHLPLEWYP